MAKGKKKQQRAAAERQPARCTGAVRQIDLHGYTADQATEVVRAALRARSPGQLIQFITGVGNHSVDSIPVLKLRLVAMFEAWSVRSQWHRGVFTVVVPDATTLERMGWQTDLSSGSGTSNVRVVSREQVELARKQGGAASTVVWLSQSTDLLGRASEFPSLATAEAIRLAQQCDPMAEAIRLSKASAKHERRKMAQAAQNSTPPEDPADVAALMRGLAASRNEAASATEREEEAMAMAIARSLEARSPTGKTNREDDAALAIAIARSLQEAEDRAMAHESKETAGMIADESFQFAEEARRMAEEAWAVEEQHSQNPQLEPEPTPEPTPEPEPELGRAIDTSTVATVGTKESAKAPSGFNALSPWARFVCDSRAYYWHMETEQLSRVPPAEGVLDEVPVPKAEFDPVYADAAIHGSGDSSASRAASAKMLSSSDAQSGMAQLQAFLAAQRQTKLEELLLSHGIRDLGTLARLTERELKAMGVAKGPRVKILRTVGDWLPDAVLAHATESGSRPPGIDLAGALFAQAQELAAGFVVPVKAPPDELNAAATVGDEAHVASTAARTQLSTSPVHEQAASDADIGKMMELGFGADLSRQALLRCGGELRSALEWALASGA